MASVLTRMAPADAMVPGTETYLTPAFLDAEQEAAAERERLRDAASGIVNKLEKLADEAMSARSATELRWLEDTRAYLGFYDDTTRADLVAARGRSQSFINITQPKTDTMKAKLVDLLFPTDERNWGINATPVPDLAETAKVAMQEAMQAVEEANRLQAQAGDPEQVTPESQAAIDRGQAAATAAAEAQGVIDEATKRAEAMERLIDDQLTQSQYPKRARDAIEYACKLGPGIMKGPLVRGKARAGWKQGQPDQADPAQQGPWTLEHMDDPTIEYAAVSPWDFFPDPSATSMDDCEYTLQRHMPTKDMLRRLTRKMGFDKNAVREILLDTKPFSAPKNVEYLAQIRSMSGEMTPITGRYLLWEYHGTLEIEDIATLMRARGRPGDSERGIPSDEEAAEAFERDADPLDSRPVIAWFCEGKLLKLSEHYPMDSGESLYNVFSLKKGEASILGAYGMPRILYHPQKALNAAWRMMLDNARNAVGPQVLIDKGAVEPQNGAWGLEPNKEWLFDSAKATVQMPFQVFNIPMNQEALAGIIALALQFADDVSMLPRVLQGADQGQGALITQTANGMAMLFNAANLAIRDVVKNWDDDLTTGLIRRAYDWNMQHAKDESVKGDMQIEARGTSVLLVREMQAQNLMGLTERWSVHPVLGVAMKVYRAARKALQAMSINPDDVLESEDEYKRRTDMLSKQASEQGGDQTMAIRLQIAQLENETRLQIADIAHRTALMELAEKLNMDADKIEAMMTVERERIQSQERKLAVEYAGEQEARREAQAMGVEPKGSGGSFSA